MMPVFHPEAAEEFEESVRFYRDRGRVLGDRFASEVRATIQKILGSPTRWRVLDEDVRLCLVRVFPYSVLYTVEADFILIIAVMHGKREPGYWKHRLASKPNLRSR
jgi:plasmid stabilization system protein ParE